MDNFSREHSSTYNNVDVGVTSLNQHNANAIDTRAGLTNFSFFWPTLQRKYKSCYLFFAHTV